MDWKIELIILPVTDVDRARDFYANQIGFHVDHDHVVSDEMRFVQLTPPGSGCSIAIGKGLTDAEPGSVQGLQIVVDDIEAARAQLLENGVDIGPVDVQPWGHFLYFADPDGNRWNIQYIPSRQSGIAAFLANREIRLTCRRRRCRSAGTLCPAIGRRPIIGVAQNVHPLCRSF